jgi:molecular chaperone DnaK
MYSQEQAQSGGGAEAPHAGGGEKTVEGDVVDAEFEEVKDKK